MTFAASSSGGVVVGAVAGLEGVVVRGTIHRPVRVHFRPQMMVRPRKVILQPILEKLMSQPALQIVTMERGE